MTAEHSGWVPKHGRLHPPTARHVQDVDVGQALVVGTPRDLWLVASNSAHDEQPVGHERCGVVRAWTWRRANREDLRRSHTFSRKQCELAELKGTWTQGMHSRK